MQSRAMQCAKYNVHRQCSYLNLHSVVCIVKYALCNVLSVMCKLHNADGWAPGLLILLQLLLQVDPKVLKEKTYVKIYIFHLIFWIRKTSRKETRKT